MNSTVTDNNKEILVDDYELVDANEVTSLTDYMIPISIKQIKTAEETCKIRAIFTNDIPDNISITLVTITISDILIDMSKAFKLNLRDKE